MASDECRQGGSESILAGFDQGHEELAHGILGSGLGL